MAVTTDNMSEADVGSLKAQARPRSHERLERHRRHEHDEHHNDLDPPGAGDGNASLRTHARGGALLTALAALPLVLRAT